MWKPFYVMIHQMNVSHINGLNSSPPGKNGHHFTDNIVRYIFVNEKFCILIKISLKFVAEGPVDNNPSLVKIMACCPKSRQAIIWTNADPICWCIYVALGGDELIDKYFKGISYDYLIDLAYTNISKHLWYYKTLLHLSAKQSLHHASI